MKGFAFIMEIIALLLLLVVLVLIATTPSLFDENIKTVSNRSGVNGSNAG